jgi:hypothetical protein
MANRPRADPGSEALTNAAEVLLLELAFADLFVPFEVPLDVPFPVLACAADPDPRLWPAVELAYGNVVFFVVSRYMFVAGQPWHAPIGLSCSKY